MNAVYRCGQCKNCKDIVADCMPKDCIELEEKEYDIMRWINIFWKLKIIDLTPNQ